MLSLIGETRPPGDAMKNSQDKITSTSFIVGVLFAIVPSLFATNANAETAAGSAAAKSAEPISADLSPADQAALAALDKKMTAMEVGQAKRVAELEKEYADVNLTGVLSPENLVQPAGLSRARKMVDRFASLVLGRVFLLQQFIEEDDRAINASDLSASGKKSLLAAMRERTNLQRKPFDALSNAQGNMLDALTNILSLAEKNAGKLKLKSDVLVFPTTEDAENYETNLRALSKAQDDEFKAQQILAGTVKR